MYGIGNIVPNLKGLFGVGTPNTLGKLPPMESPSGNAFDIDYVPLSQIFTDEKNFQNRADKYSEKSVKSIINAVDNDAFNWFAFDPVTLWLNPSDGKYYVLSGHSRTQAFRELSKRRPRPIVDGLSFDKIPAKIFKGSFDDAKYLALNSNTLGTPETLTERADYYRAQRSMADGSQLKALKKKALRENNGQLIWDLSYLPANGMTMQALKSFKVDGQDSMENFVRLATIAQWIGKAFQIYKGLSLAHDQELLKFLLNGGYGSKSGQYFSFTALNDRLEKLYKKNVAYEKYINRHGEYTKPFQIAAYAKSDDDLEEINDLKKVADNALKDLKKSLKNLRDNNSDRETIYKVATPYFNGWANALYDWWQVLDRVPVKDNAPSLFGLGRVSYSDVFAKLPSRLDDLANYIIKNVNNSNYDFSQISKADAVRDYIDFEMKFDPRQKNALEVLKSQVIDRKPTKGEIRGKQVQWNRWSHNQVMWGKFIEKCKPLITPENLMSDKFTVYIITNYIDDKKQFDNIAEALDYAFEYGFLRNYSFFIINDNESRILASNELEKDKKYIQSLSGLCGLGKPTIKLEFEDNAELLAFQEQMRNALPSETILDWDAKEDTFKPVSGLTVNDRPAAIFNCPESQLQTQGYYPTYKILDNYDNLVDSANGAKTLKGYGFEKSTLDELINATSHYAQVERLADHLKDPNGDKMQSAFNVWHWLHTNVKYDYDKAGEEEIRTPARAYADRNKGIDCDCLAVLTAALLINMGYKPKFEIVGFNNEPQYSHIYVNLDGAAIDRVLPVFLARPDGITKTKIMEIPVYSLSGLCDNLRGVYNSTLQKIATGTATAEDANNFRKTQVLVTLRGIDDAAYKLASLLMPYTKTIGDDGTYYFNNAALANLANKLDFDLSSLLQSGADDIAVNQWLTNAAEQIQAASQQHSDEDTIIVIINPKGSMTQVVGDMAKSSTPTLSTLTESAIQKDNQTASPAAIYSVSPEPQPTEEKSNIGWWIALVAAFGAGAIISGKNKTKKR